MSKAATAFTENDSSRRSLWGTQPRSVQTLHAKMDADYQSQTEPLTGNNITRVYTSMENVPLHQVFVDVRMVRSEKLYDRVGPNEQQGTATERERMAHVYSKRADQLQSVQLRNILTFGSRMPPGLRRGLEQSERSTRLLALACARCWKKHGVCT